MLAYFKEIVISPWTSRHDNFFIVGNPMGCILSILIIKLHFSNSLSSVRALQIKTELQQFESSGVPPCLSPEPTSPVWGAKEQVLTTQTSKLPQHQYFEHHFWHRILMRADTAMAIYYHVPIPLNWLNKMVSQGGSLLTS